MVVIVALRGERLVPTGLVIVVRDCIIPTCESHLMEIICKVDGAYICLRRCLVLGSAPTLSEKSPVFKSHHLRNVL